MNFCDVLFIEVSGERAWIKTEAEDPGAWAYGEVQVLSRILIDVLSNMSAEYKQRGESQA